MYDNVTAAMVLWNEAHRIDALVAALRPYFREVVIGVQESTDGTLGRATELADRVVTDAHHGYGDVTFGPKVLPLVHTRWTFKVDGDEMPTPELMASLGDAVIRAEGEGRVGAWVRFRSWTEGQEWKQDHFHLRLFQTSLGWPSTMHSRPMTDNTITWDVDGGYIAHVRSLDEMMSDYLNYYQRGLHDPGWVAHNTLMMREACLGTARDRGWDHVKSFPWWPEVRAIAFPEGEP